ncbi:MAG: ABC transporter ATP-binding protein, partial [Candidatus Marinimicrobia bacterium]|nr:ABC transporter ATP-binding protein [Candidatus Neomarinimicrobiota bacterium]
MKNGQLITIKGLVKDYPVGRGYFRALSDINLTIGEGEFAGLVGPSGSGKTTLLNIVGSLDVPTKGEVRVLGHSVGQLNARQSAQLRNHSLGFIFQTYNLLPVYNVFENVELPLLLLKMEKDKRCELVDQA